MSAYHFSTKQNYVPTYVRLTSFSGHAYMYVVEQALVGPVKHVHCIIVLTQCLHCLLQIPSVFRCFRLCLEGRDCLVQHDRWLGSKCHFLFSCICARLRHPKRPYRHTFYNWPKRRCVHVCIIFLRKNKSCVWPPFRRKKHVVKQCATI